jgi:hypothetical protein
MDSKQLGPTEYFAVPIKQTVNAIDRNVNTSSLTTAQPDGVQPASSLWDASIAMDAAVSDSIATGPSGASLASFVQPSTGPTNLSFGSRSRSSVYGQSKTGFPTKTPQSVGGPSRGEGHERKRAKVNSEAAALESVDYWIRFDDDDPDKGAGESFEIDFSKRRNNPSNIKRCVEACHGWLIVVA